MSAVARLDSGAALPCRGGACGGVHGRRPESARDQPDLREPVPVGLLRGRVIRNEKKQQQTHCTTGAAGGQPTTWQETVPGASREAGRHARTNIHTHTHIQEGNRGGEEEEGGKGAAEEDACGTTNNASA